MENSNMARKLEMFDAHSVQQWNARLDQLTPESQPLWGKMNAAQMLAHLSVAYDLAFDPQQKEINGLKKWFLKKFIKPIVVGPKPYKRNSPTPQRFIVSDQRDFEREKEKLISYLNKCLEKGVEFFEGKNSTSFGTMTAEEWNNQFTKHLEHHFAQFGI